MSEFGSYKSASSVSQSSASSGSQPPDSSSSSSDEVHDCQRCGDCCYSDKSRVRLSLRNLPESWIDAVVCEPYPDTRTDHLPDVTNIELPFAFVAGGNYIWTLGQGTPPTQSGDPPYYVYTATRLCAQGRWSFEVRVTYWDDDQGIPIVVDIFDSATQCGGTVLAAGTCCGVSGPTGIGYLDDYDVAEGLGATDGTVEIEVHNNPCCLDDVGFPGCFRHFNGDCRGNCDGDPSSSAEPSSSEWNPLP